MTAYSAPLPGSAIKALQFILFSVTLNMFAFDDGFAGATSLPVTSSETQLAQPCLSQGEQDAQTWVNTCTRMMGIPTFARDAWPYAARARGYGAMGRIDLALDDLDTAIGRADSSDPNLSAMYHLRCNYRAKIKSGIAGAISDCEKAASLKPNTNTYEELGNLQFFDGQYDASLKSQNTAIALAPTDFALYIERSMSFTDLNRDSEAIEDLGEAISLRPNDFNGYYLRGQAYMKTGQYARAVPEFDQTIKLNPAASFAFAARGIAQMHLGDNVKAISDLTEAIKMNPKLAIAYYVRGLARRSLGDTSGGDTDVAVANSIDSSVAQKIDTYRY